MSSPRRHIREKPSLASSKSPLPSHHAIMPSECTISKRVRQDSVVATIDFIGGPFCLVNNGQGMAKGSLAMVPTSELDSSISRGPTCVPNRRPRRPSPPIQVLRRAAKQLRDGLAPAPGTEQSNTEPSELFFQSARSSSPD
ncbi:unnamed protein product [Diplocarpon coronariae]|uniref:Uncharacterized protein n=1 Tax=Diplocarpon coronariae TaxID=2795749 RepID=A0A218ZBU1_9HELO|nr:hypothetical protein JHW43_000453 [Diplocarpon mali]OWP04755.1 hypothetical protein B2J93_4037 [Marssonina coronariae]